jgi:hypothetical protein
MMCSRNSHVFDISKNQIVPHRLNRRFFGFGKGYMTMHLHPLRSFGVLRITQGNWMLSAVALKHMLEHYGENNACYNSCHKSDEVAPLRILPMILTIPI